ncbi:GNAT family N-acetyltransferase [Sphingomonas sp. ERG5]|uniref:GNAT family N-acetyltransferase n=1 Tax=Sphingomonas sp. ERG5 TaxID=1381597 RepID=UPI00054B3FD2|nr:N-acetyltransferase [Sphingomonas sp. ERG5]
MIEIVPIANVSNDAVEDLLDRAFGADRHGRTAYRIRDGVSALPRLSFAALDNGALIATIQCWPVLFTGDDGGLAPLIMVGPVAVEPARQRDGIGRMLMRHALDTADARGESHALMLIGDPEYYSRFFGFSAERTGEWRVPGPVERQRLLSRGDRVPTSAGSLGPRVHA